MESVHNAPRTLYKVLASDGEPVYGGSGRWLLPSDGGTGAWMPPVRGRLVACRNGYHLARPEQLVRWIGPALFEAEAGPEVLEDGDKLIARTARLVRRVEGWNERTARLFAADCAERVLPLYERCFPEDDRPRRAIEATRRFARGEIGPTKLRAAEEDAWTAWKVAEAAPGGVTVAKAALAALAAWAAGAAWAYRAAEAARAAASRGTRQIPAVADRIWQTERLRAYLAGEVPVCGRESRA